jgi:hypothetical protein
LADSVPEFQFDQIVAVQVAEEDIIVLRSAYAWFDRNRVFRVDHDTRRN